MVQVQINVTIANSKLGLEIFQLKREDASEDEISVGRNLEKMIEGLLLGTAKESGFRVKTRKIIKAPKAK